MKYANAPRSDSLDENISIRTSQLVERIRQGGYTTDEVIDHFAQPKVIKWEDARLSRYISSLEDALLADKVFFDHEEKMCITSQDWKTIKDLIKELKARNTSEPGETMGKDPMLGELVEVLRNPEAAITKYHADTQNAEHLTDLLTAERRLNSSIAQEKDALQEQVKYLNNRLKEEARLRSEYGKKETEVLANATWTNIAWAVTWKFLRRAPTKLREYIVLIATVIMAAPFVVSVAAAPIGIVIMLLALIIPGPSRPPYEEYEMDPPFLEEREEVDGVSYEESGQELVSYNVGLIDLLGWIVVGGVLAAPLLLPLSSV